MNDCLKSKELMIGDWVMYDPSASMETYHNLPVKCRPIMIASGENIENAIDGHYRPIPLTMRILEQNKWVYIPNEGVYRSPEQDETGKIIRLQAVENGNAFWWIVGSNIISTINYVHELQHLLRLRGLREMADSLNLNDYNEMKPEELMIGDWVMYNPNVFIEDEYEPHKEPCYTQIGSGEDIDLAIEGCYSPIPLTGKMLASNGFDWNDDNGYFALWINDNEGVFVKMLLGGSLNIQSQLNQFNISCNIYYLHDLQHILRLCGLREIADNLKNS